MSVTSVNSRHARLDVQLDGIRISRSPSDAARRGTEPVELVAWDDVTGARVERTAKGRAVVRIGVRGVQAPADHRDDRYAVKAGSDQTDDADVVAALVNDEVATRNRWRDLAGRDPSSADDVPAGI